jgi:hypothetical protein
MALPAQLSTGIIIIPPLPQALGPWTSRPDLAARSSA